MFFKKKRFLPTVVQIEGCSMCNLNCRNCYMREHNFGIVKPGYLKLEDFVSFLDKNPFIKKIELCWNGEIFLNPDLLDILKVAYERKVVISFNTVNFNKASDEIIEAIVKYKLLQLTVAIDGACQETYSKYRRGGNFDTVINNIKKINEYKKKYNSILPIMQWQYIVMDTNDSEEEILKAKEIAKSLGCEIYFKKDWIGWKPINPKPIEKLTGLDYSDVGSAFARRDKKIKRFIPCLSTILFPAINWDGRFLMCCCNYFKDVDINVFELGLKKALKHPLVKKTRKMIMGGKICKNSPCYKCQFYWNMVKEKNFVAKEDIDRETFERKYNVF